MSPVDVTIGKNVIWQLRGVLDENPTLKARFNAIRRFASTIRSSEYHLTNSCNIRCEGCWFFTYDFHLSNKEERDPVRLDEFVDREVARGINSALLIGGEPTLFPQRIQTYRDRMPYVTISTNGLRKLQRAGFEDITVAISLFGGGPLDDELRAIRPGGKKFTGLFDEALKNYRDDPRAGFVFALSEPGVPYIEETVARIGDNGNRVHFNFYSAYDTDDPLGGGDRRRLLDEALRVREAYPEIVASHPYYIEAMVTGATDWGTFGYEVCPSLSTSHPAHTRRLRNGAPVLPRFNVWGADLESLQFCCTSGHCDSCRDSQAIMSWLMTNPLEFVGSVARLQTWVEMAEAYWSQFYWSPFHPSAGEGLVQERADVV